MLLKGVKTRVTSDSMYFVLITTSEVIVKNGGNFTDYMSRQDLYFVTALVSYL